MRLAKGLSIVGFVIMAFMILRALFAGDFNGEGATIIGGPWGQLSLVDVYIGFFLFAGWIIYRERSVPVMLIWIAFLLFLGNLTACLYVLVALQTSKGDWQTFWMGHRATQYQ